MKTLGQIVIILLVSFAGELLNYCLPLPIPASIYGIVILFCLLDFKVIPLRAVKETGAFLVSIMQLMFIPAAVGLLEAWDVIAPNWLLPEQRKIFKLPADPGHGLSGHPPVRAV